MIMELLGPNLEEVFTYFNKKLTIKTVSYVGMQIVILTSLLAKKSRIDP